MDRRGSRCEIVAAPSVLLLDEPTSGLDSHQALKVMRSLQDLARTGRTVICSIHQPGSAIYALFDRVFVVLRARCAGRGDVRNACPYTWGRARAADFPPARCCAGAFDAGHPMN